VCSSDLTAARPEARAVIPTWKLLAMLAQLADGAAADAPTPVGYGAQLVRSLAVLAGVCLAAWWTLRWAARRGLGRLGAGRDVRVRERVALDARRSVYLVEVGRRTLLLGASDGAALTLLAEVSPDDLAPAGVATDAPTRGETRAPGAHGAVGASFATVLARIRGAPPASSTAAASPPDASSSEPRA
jgi:flagellar protein FliO/FliZ